MPICTDCGRDFSSGSAICDDCMMRSGLRALRVLEIEFAEAAAQDKDYSFCAMCDLEMGIPGDGPLCRRCAAGWKQVRRCIEKMERAEIKRRAT